MLIGLSGGMGSGKDYVALNFVFKEWSRVEPTMILSFADHFKIDIVTKDKACFEHVFVPDRKERPQEVRQLLQRRGTEEGRCRYGPNIWVETMEAWIRVHSARGIKRFIIPEVRFPNEAAWIRKQGGTVVFLSAPQRNWKRALAEADHDETAARKLLSHASETGISSATPEHWDRLIGNDFGQEDSCAHSVLRLFAS